MKQNLDVHEEAAKRKQQKYPHEHEPLHGVELTSPAPITHSLMTV